MLRQVNFFFVWFQLAHQWSSAANNIDTTDPVGEKRKELQNRGATGQYSTLINDCNNVTTEEVDK